MTYEQLLQQQPPSTAAGDLSAAKAFVDAISQALSRNLIPDLTVANQNYLYRLRAKWQQRAHGKDAAWMQYGSKPGRRPHAARKRGNVDPTAYGSEDELDPLLRSLLKKYGNE